MASVCTCRASNLVIVECLWRIIGWLKLYDSLTSLFYHQPVITHPHQVEDTENADMSF